MNAYRGLSLWHDTGGEELDPRPPLTGSLEVDVVIVGAGYTGLWTAYYLKRNDPNLAVAIIESEIAGFGASGRNGGWCAGEIAGNRERMAAEAGRQQVISLWREMFATVDEVARVVSVEGIDCHFHKGGILNFATSVPQAVRLQEQIAYERSWGFGPDDFSWIPEPEMDRIGRLAGSRGALFTPHAAAIHPLRLARGLARVVESLGVRIYERTRAHSLQSGVVLTDGGDVRAEVVLRCTEAFTVQMPGQRRAFIPVYSLMMATEPLPISFWDRVGLEDRQVFKDARHLVIYGQRTADDRIAFGGRGALYHFASAISPEFDRRPSVHASLRRILWGLFPDLGKAAVTHTWGGAVAIPRDWRPSVFYDRRAGVGDAGGYVGEGVAASNLAGRTMADLVLGRDTDITRLPWVGHRSPRWEPEPLRWMGVNAGTLLAPWADSVERRSGRPSRLLGGALGWLTGK